MRKLSFIALAFLIAVGSIAAPTVSEAADLNEKDIPDAYDDTFDTPGFEAASSGGDTFAVTGSEIILIKNTDSSDSDVTINSVADNLGRSNDLTDTVPANGQVMVGPMKREGWEISGGSNDGTIKITYPDGNSGIEVAIIRVKEL